MNIINELGALAFVSRLKRLSDRLSKDGTQLYQQLNVKFEARWFTIIYTLYYYSPMPITTLAESLGITHSAVNQLSFEMLKNGLLISTSGKNDRRQRILSISSKGRDLVLLLTPIWREIRLATEELIHSVDPNLLSTIGKIENKLDKQNMHERVWLKLKGQPPGEIAILEYRPAYKKYFNSLNQEWLREYFEIEKEDQKVLSDPNGKILKKGGAIFFASFNNKIVGTCALIVHKNGIYELIKMAVTKNAQELGIGKELANKIIDHAKSIGASEIYLQTNAKLKVANHIYNSIGFKKIQTSPFSVNRYIRPTYTMKLLFRG